ncbi:MAG: AGE family epimerase/isomerase [Janthinobacterium lividum]
MRAHIKSRASLARRHGDALLWATPMKTPSAALLLLLFAAPFAAGQTPVPAQTSAAGPELPATAASYRHYAAETEAMLHHDVLDVWYPRTVDTENGGFYADFDRQWHRLPSHGKFSVFEGRMTWTAANAITRRPALRAQYLPFVDHGVKYLENTMWDKQYGGFYWGLADDGTVSPQFGDGKHMYGISFCIYALAAAYRVTHDPATLALAQKAFRWNEDHAHDATNGGYYEWLTREGKPMLVPPYTPTAVFLHGADSPVGYKSMNTHIHLLEAYTELYSVWKDDRLKQRTAELLSIVRDKIVVQPGAMNLYFTAAWQPVPDHDSYGHDVETTYLLDEAADTLGHGFRDQPTDDRTRQTGRLLVDHALAYGWDADKGGLFHSGAFVGKPDDLLKEWWVQMESLNALLLLHQRYGRETDVYWKAFQQQWAWIRQYQVDPEFGGEYNLVKPDGQPVSPIKGSMWKGAYHESRALLNVTDRLNAMAAAAGSR